ncbi:MAG: nuclear transport factor 2 family protein [Gammaproteobacteria bacterium]
MMRILVLLWGLIAFAIPAGAWAQDEADAALRQLVADYTGLYTKQDLPRWRELFLPGFTAASTNEDGSVSVRMLDAFHAAQESGFAESADMGERLENVRIERHGDLASVWADFVFWADGPPSRGRLVLLAIRQAEGWRLHSLMFAY